MFRNFMETAADYTERNDIPCEFWRNDVGDWHLTMKFRDSEGWFNAVVPFPDMRKPKDESEAEWCERHRLTLSKAVQKARADRIRSLTRRVTLAARAA